MLRLSGVCLFLSLLTPATVAAAATDLPFAGRWYWDGPETCPANYTGENRAIEIKGRSVIFHENTCDVRSLHKLDNNAYRFEMNCHGESETDHSNTLFTVLAKSKINDELLLRIELKTGFALAYRRCP
jgi:hypothetical protein